MKGLCAQYRNINKRFETESLRTEGISFYRNIHQGQAPLLRAFDLAGKEDRAHARSVNRHATKSTLTDGIKYRVVIVRCQLGNGRRFAARNDQSVDIFQLPGMAYFRCRNTALF